MKKGVKWLFILSSIIVLTLVVVNMFVGQLDVGHVHSFSQQMSGGHHGMRGGGGPMGYGHHGRGGIPWSLILIPLIMLIAYVVYKSKKRQQPALEELVTVQDLTVPTSYSTRDMLDEWEQSIRKGESKHGDF